MFRTALNGIVNGTMAVAGALFLGAGGLTGDVNVAHAQQANEMAATASPHAASSTRIESYERTLNRVAGVSIQSASVSVSESAGSAVLSLTLSEAAVQVVDVVVHTVPGSATGGEDYIGFTRTIRFAPGETEKTLSVTLIDDGVVEAVESVAVRIAQANNAEIIVERATLTIVDDDGDSSQPVVAEILDAEVSESTANALVEVRLQQPAVSPVSIGFATGSATAQPGSDYYGVYTELVIQPGESSSRVAVEIIDDSLVEADELIATRVFAWAPNITFSRAQGNIKITDDDDDDSELSPEQKRWLSEIKRLINNGSKNWAGDPDKLLGPANLGNCATRNNVPGQGSYNYGRAGQSYMRAISTAWYETRDRTVLAELYRLSARFWSNFQDHDNRGYPFVYFARNDPRFCGDDAHSMDEILAHALLAHVAHVFDASRSIDPRYAALANQIVSYLDSIWVPKWMNRMNPSVYPEPVSGSNRGVTNAWLNRSRFDSDMTYFIRGLAHADMAGMEFFYTLGELTGDASYTTHAQAYCRYAKSQGMSYLSVNDSYAWKHLPFLPYDPEGSPVNPFQETRDYGQIWMTFAPNMNRHGWCFSDRDMTRFANTYFSGNARHDVFEANNTATMAEDVEGGNDSFNDDSERFTGQPGVAKFRMLSAAYLCDWDETGTIKDLAREAATNNIVDQRYPDSGATSPIMAAGLLTCT